MTIISLAVLEFIDFLCIGEKREMKTKSKNQITHLKQRIMKKFIFNSMLLGGLMMASCSEDVMETPKQEEVQKTYAQKFTEKFGPIAADQDWNMAEGKSINVNGASRAAGDDLKIYAKYQGVYRLVAHFDDASQATYDFTSPKGVNEFIVTCGGQIQMVENGGTVDLSGGDRRFRRRALPAGSQSAAS